MSSTLDLIPVYDGEIRGNRVGRFLRAGITFDIIRPGYDAQGRRRHTWTQFLYEGVPVFEVRKLSEIDAAMDQFDDLWDEHIKVGAATGALGLDAYDYDLLTRALDVTKRGRLARFRDGRTGESPAPAYSVDGRGEGKRYPA